MPLALAFTRFDNGTESDTTAAPLAPVAFFYVRFSTRRQSSSGDSLRGGSLSAAAIMRHGMALPPGGVVLKTLVCAEIV
jgi:hypothetical protein